MRSDTEADTHGLIGKRAAELCYSDPNGATCQDYICVGSCAAVCPEDKYLIAASREVFSEYWASRVLEAREEEHG